MANALDAFNQGYGTSWDRQEALTNKLTNRQAGAALAAGDYGGAAGTLYKAGDLGMGSQVQNYGQAQEDRAAKQEEDARQAEEKANKERLGKELEYILGASKALASIVGPDPQTTEAARVQAFDQHIAPALRVQGADDDVIQKMRGGGFSDDTLRTFGATVERALDQWKVLNTSGGVVAVRTRQGEEPEAKVLYQDPLSQDLKRAQIERARRPPRPAGGAGQPVVPAGFTLD